MWVYGDLIITYLKPYSIYVKGTISLLPALQALDLNLLVRKEEYIEFKVQGLDLGFSS